MNIFNKLITLEKAAEAFGFRWNQASQIMEQIQSECTEINEHLPDSANEAVRIKLQEEIGDLLHAVFSLCVFCKFDPEQTLAKSLDKFAHRFQTVQNITKDKGLTSLEGKSFAELMAIWNQAKKAV